MKLEYATNFWRQERGGKRISLRSFGNICYLSCLFQNYCRHIFAGCISIGV